MNRNERVNQLWIEFLRRSDSLRHENGTRALQLIGLAGGLLLASLALLDFTATSLDGAARPAFLLLLVGGGVTALFGTYLLAAQLLRRDPWDLNRTYLFQLIDVEDPEWWVNETARRLKKKESGLRAKLFSRDTWPLFSALLGLLVEIAALLTLGVIYWQS